MLLSDSDNEKRYERPPMDQELFSGLIRLHILHHAEKGPVFGGWIMEELARHGYRLSPGTLYPLLHRMEEKGYLASRRELGGGKYRRLYRITPRGRGTLRSAENKVRELFEEMFRQKSRPPRPRIKS